MPGGISEGNLQRRADELDLRAPRAVERDEALGRAQFDAITLGQRRHLSVESMTENEVRKYRILRKSANCNKIKCMSFKIS